MTTGAEREAHMQILRLRALEQIGEGRVRCDYRGRCHIKGVAYGGIGWSLWPVEDAMKEGLATRGEPFPCSDPRPTAASWPVLLTDAGRQALASLREDSKQ